jgi:hypothetical protein
LPHAASTSFDAAFEPCDPTFGLMSKFSILKEFWAFLCERKKWWLAPIVVFLMLFGALLIFAKGSALAPFIYSLF